MLKIAPLLLVFLVVGCNSLKMSAPSQSSSQTRTKAEEAILKELEDVLMVGMTWDEAWAALGVAESEVGPPSVVMSHRALYCCPRKRFPDAHVDLIFETEDDGQFPESISGLNGWHLAN